MEKRPADILAGLTEPETDALVEILLLAALADGALAQAESAVIKRALLSVDELWLNHIDLEKRMTKARARIEAETAEARLTKLRTMLPWPEQRALALKLAIQIVEADGVVQSSERELIMQAAQALGVQGDIAAKFTLAS
ncbi:MAG TPA: TerB family tellurite resistance protein [Polyangiaceae bacterium]|nr:TerB family tellurite resistance protein [Polyangiaceae bacterium]